jgi:hypothetical protein
MWKKEKIRRPAPAQNLWNRLFSYFNLLIINEKGENSHLPQEPIPFRDKNSGSHSAGRAWHHPPTGLTSPEACDPGELLLFCTGDKGIFPIYPLYLPYITPKYPVSY